MTASETVLNMIYHMALCFQDFKKSVENVLYLLQSKRPINSWVSPWTLIQLRSTESSKYNSETFKIVPVVYCVTVAERDDPVAIVSAVATVSYYVSRTLIILPYIIHTTKKRICLRVDTNFPSRKILIIIFLTLGQIYC